MDPEIDGLCVHKIGCSQIWVLRNGLVSISVTDVYNDQCISTSLIFRLIVIEYDEFSVKDYYENVWLSTRFNKPIFEREIIVCSENWISWVIH